MDCDVASAPATYLNRPPGPPRALWRTRLQTTPARPGTGRAVDRMLVALRAYEQRAERRASLRAWLIARRAAGTAGDPRGPVDILV